LAQPELNRHLPTTVERVVVSDFRSLRGDIVFRPPLARQSPAAKSRSKLEGIVPRGNYPAARPAPGPFLARKSPAAKIPFEIRSRKKVREEARWPPVLPLRTLK